MGDAALEQEVSADVWEDSDGESEEEDDDDDDSDDDDTVI